MAPHRSRALLLLDVTPATIRPTGIFAKNMAPGTDFDALAASLSKALRAARAAGDTVVWVVPGDEVIRRYGKREPTPQDGRPDELVGTPRDGEPLVPKAEIGAFEGSTLASVLNQQGVGEVVLAGVATQFVVKLTAQEAVRLGLDVTILADCCADLTPEAHAAALDGLRDSCKITTVGELWSAS